MNKTLLALTLTLSLSALSPVVGAANNDGTATLNDNNTSALDASDSTGALFDTPASGIQMSDSSSGAQPAAAPAAQTAPAAAPAGGADASAASTPNTTGFDPAAALNFDPAASGGAAFDPTELAPDGATGSQPVLSGDDGQSMSDRADKAMKADGAAMAASSDMDNNNKYHKPQTNYNLKNPKYGSYYAPSCSPVVPKLDKEAAKYRKLADKYEKDAQKVIELADKKLQKIQENALKRSQSIKANAEERKRLELESLVVRTQRQEMKQLGDKVGKGDATSADFDRFKRNMEAIENNYGREQLRVEQIQSRADVMSKSIVEKAALDAEALKAKSENLRALADRAMSAKDYYTKYKCVDRGQQLYRRYVRRGRWGGGRTWAGTRRTRPVINYFSDIEHVTQDFKREANEIEVQHALGSYGKVVRHTRLKREKENQKRRLEREIFHVH